MTPVTHLTAQAWVHEGFPNAAYFDTRMGRWLFWPMHAALSRLRTHAPSLPWHEEFLFIRHYAYEERLRDLSPDFVLEAGAGLSPRGLTFASEYPHLVYVEVDLPHIVATKRRLLKHMSLPPNYHIRAADLLAYDFAESIGVHPKPGHKLAVVTEGVTDYLGMEEKRRAWHNIAGFLRLHGGGVYLFDVYTRQRLAKYPRSASVALKLLSIMVGEPFEKRLFADADAALAMARASGFDAAEILDVEALNPSRYRPPSDYRHFELIEARVHAG